MSLLWDDFPTFDVFWGTSELMPTWMLWLSLPVVAPMVAVAWLSWRARPKGPVAASETVEEYDRFKAALTSPLPASSLPHPRKKPSRSVRPKEPTT